MATIYLHIGAPKTATSTLQNVLAKNYQRLLNDGVLYPQNILNADAHHVLACDLIEKCQGGEMSDAWYGSLPRGRGWQSLRDEIESHKHKVHSVIVSTELFFGQTKSLEVMLDEIAGCLSGYEVKVIAYLRRQDRS